MDYSLLRQHRFKGRFQPGEHLQGPAEVIPTQFVQNQAGQRIENPEEWFVIPNHGDLTGLAQQGVLLLNCWLTVQEGVPKSHRVFPGPNGVTQGQKYYSWETVTDAIISAVSKHCRPGVVFMLWGAHAKNKAKLIDGSNHHVIIKCHPSPRAAKKSANGWFDPCHYRLGNQTIYLGQFQLCNHLLGLSGRLAINWNRL